MSEDHDQSDVRNELMSMNVTEHEIVTRCEALRARLFYLTELAKSLHNTETLKQQLADCQARAANAAARTVELQKSIDSQKSFVDAAEANRLRLEDLLMGYDDELLRIRNGIIAEIENMDSVSQVDAITRLSALLAPKAEESPNRPHCASCDQED